MGPMPGRAEPLAKILLERRLAAWSVVFAWNVLLGDGDPAHLLARKPQQLVAGEAKSAGGTDLGHIVGGGSR